MRSRVGARGLGTTEVEIPRVAAGGRLSARGEETPADCGACVRRARWVDPSSVLGAWAVLCRRAAANDAAPRAPAPRQAVAVHGTGETQGPPGWTALNSRALVPHREGAGVSAGWRQPVHGRVSALVERRRRASARARRPRPAASGARRADESVVVGNMDALSSARGEARSRLRSSPSPEDRAARAVNASVARRPGERCGPARLLAPQLSSRSRAGAGQGRGRQSTSNEPGRPRRRPRPLRASCM